MTLAKLTFLYILTPPPPPPCRLQGPQPITGASALGARRLWALLRAGPAPLGGTRERRRPTRAPCGISTPPVRDPKLASSTAQTSTTVMKVLILKRFMKYAFLQCAVNAHFVSVLKK
jgi:hypothetical protein